MTGRIWIMTKIQMLLSKRVKNDDERTVDRSLASGTLEFELDVTRAVSGGLVLGKCVAGMHGSRAVVCDSITVANQCAVDAPFLSLE